MSTAAALFLAAQTGLICAAICGLAALTGRIEERRDIRRGIRDIEARINHPGVRAHYLNPDRKEKP